MVILRNYRFVWIVFFLFSCKQEDSLSGASFSGNGSHETHVKEISDEQGSDEGQAGNEDDEDGIVLTQENTVCDPLGGTSHGTDQNGLLGKLFYSAKRYATATEYIQKGTKADVHLLLSHINVPTRKFDLGFETEAGQLILNAQGTPLYEDFALELESKLVLGQNDEPGFYEFAVLGDDGVNLYLNGEKIIAMDFQTSTMMGCDSKYTYIDHSSRIPLKLEYYQGPRYHIALILLWRKVGLNEPAQKTKDISCGKHGNDLWFNFTKVPSVAKTPYIDLINRGWRVIQAENFLLSEKIKENPCEVDPDDGDNTPPGGGGVIGV